MACHRIRGTTLTTVRSNAKNEAGKGAGAAKGRVTKAARTAIGRPLPLHFLRRNSKAGNVDALMHTLAI